MFKEQRHQQILDKLAAQEAASVGELAAQLGASESTIRLDLRHLEQAGVVHRTHGGAMLVAKGAAPSITSDPTYDERLIRFPAAKRRIGKEVAALISSMVSGECLLMIDDGSTNLMVVQSVSSLSGITFLTNRMGIAEEIPVDSKHKPIMCGGQLEVEDNCVLGPLAEDNIRGFRGEAAIIGASGVTVDFGVTTVWLTKRELKRAMMQSCEKTIVAVDGSKIGSFGPVKVCSLHEVDYLVTDSSAPPDVLAKMSKAFPSLKILVAR